MSHRQQHGQRQLAWKRDSTVEISVDLAIQTLLLPHLGRERHKSPPPTAGVSAAAR